MHPAWELIQEVEELGGMAKAIETGMPKMRIEEAAARKQARIDSGKDIIVGVNAYPAPRKRAAGSVLEVDNTAVRESQVQASGATAARRAINAAVEQSLAALTQCAARRARAICWNWRWRRRASAPRWAKFPRRWKRCGADTAAVTRIISGVYSAESEMDEEFQKARQMADEFEKAEGRRPRMLVAKMGQDGHDRGSKVIATAFADWASTWTSARCSRRRARWRAMPSKTMSTWSASLRWPPGTRRWCRS